MQDQSKSFYIIFEAKKMYITYLDKGFDKIILNFVDIKIVYLEY